MRARRKTHGDAAGSELARLTPTQRQLLAALEAQPDSLQFLFAQRSAQVCGAPSKGVPCYLYMGPCLHATCWTVKRCGCSEMRTELSRLLKAPLCMRPACIADVGLHNSQRKRVQQQQSAAKRADGESEPAKRLPDWRSSGPASANALLAAAEALAADQV